MKRFERMVFPTDFKSVSQNVTENAFEFARRFSSELHFFHAELLFENDPNNPEHQMPEHAIELGEAGEARCLEEVLAQMEHQNLEIYKHEQRAILAVPAILEFIRAQHSDLVLLGTHGRKGLARWWLGSVAEGVLAGADRTVLIVRDALPEGLFQKVFHVLAPIYLDAQCRPTLELALEMAEAFDATLHILHVIPVEVHVGGSGGPLIFDLPLASLERLEELFHEIKKQAKVEVKFHSATGSPVQEILDHANRLSAGLLVMGHRDRLGFSERLKGGVTELVLRDAPCPVMTTPILKQSI